MQRARSGEQGFGLVVVVVLCFLMLLTLTIAAPTMAKKLQRDREEHTLERAHEYVRAVRLYYRKFGHYPTSIDQLEKTNNIRFLRQRYVDPLTGKDDWRIIHVGENKTQVLGFFGQPLTGLPGSGLGGSTPAGSAMGGPLGSSTSPTGTSSGGSASTSGGFSAFGATLLGGGSNSAGGSGAGAAGAGGTGATGSGTSTDPSASGTTGSTGSIGSALTPSAGMSGGGPIMGFGLAHPGDSIVVVNEQTTYDTWEFLYDPRSEPKGNVNGGGSANAGSLGGSPTTNSLTGGTNSPFGSSGATGTSGTSGTTGGGTGGTGGTTGGTGSTNSGSTF